MEFRLLILSIFAFLFLIQKGSTASIPAERYWQYMLPNTAIPKALQELLQPDAGNNTVFPELGFVPQSGQETTYGVGYWPEVKRSNKNYILFSTTIYFLHDNLLPHKKTILSFSKSCNVSNFLPRKTVESIPFSSNMFPKILEYFSINSTSKEAQIMKQTIEECEAPGITGEEEKYCATSLESLVDFVVLKFGKQVIAIYNEAEEEYKKQEYTILKGIEMMGDNQIVCHKQRYKYAVFYCHTIKATKVYMVPLVGDDGSKAKAVAVCHMNTSAWNPEHLAFQILKVKPGPSVCHFLNSDAIVFIPN